MKSENCLQNINSNKYIHTHISMSDKSPFESIINYTEGWESLLMIPESEGNGA